MNARAKYALIVAVLALGGCQTASQKASPIDSVAIDAGMARVVGSDLDALYLKEDVDFSKYTKLLLRPATISFRKSWTPERPGTLVNFSDAEIELIRSDLTKTFNTAFERTLQKGHAYQIASTPASDVLELHVEVIDVFIPAPDLSRYSATRTRSFTRDGSEMTLLAEIRDSVSGDVIGRAYDMRRASQSATFELANEITNAADARRITTAWANALRTALAPNSKDNS